MEKPALEPLPSPYQSAAPPKARGHLPIVLALGSLTGFYLFTSLYIATRRSFWFDEIYTILIARLGSYASIWQALANGSDVLPATYYMIVRPFDQVFGPGEIAPRMPSALAMIIGMLIVFDCARRLTDAVHGLIAFSLLTCSFLPYYGFEARPYSLYFMLVAASLWLWVHGRETLTFAILFGLTFLLAFAVHYYAPLCLAPYGVAMILEPAEWRTRFAKIAAGIGGVSCGALIFLRAILGARQFSAEFWSGPSLAKLSTVYLDFFPRGMFLLAGIMVWIALTSAGKQTRMLAPMSAAERTSWLFLLVPVAGYALAKLGTNAFYNRYLIGVLPGIVIAFTCLLWRHFRNSPRVSIGILVLLAAFGVYVQLHTLMDPEGIQPPSAPREPAKIAQMLRLEATLDRDAKAYIVFPADDMLGFETRYYSKYPERYIFLLDRQPRHITQVLLNVNRFSPIRFWRFDDLKAHALETVLIDPSEESVNAIQHAGFNLDSYAVGPLKVVYLR
jgi:hypothetical protein